MTEIVIREVSEEPIAVYNSNREFLGEINNLMQFTDVVLQVAQKKRKGYFIKKGDSELVITHGNTLEDHDFQQFFPNTYSIISKIDELENE
jgi:hypothetical protein